MMEVEAGYWRGSVRPFYWISCSFFLFRNVAGGCKASVVELCIDVLGSELFEMWLAWEQSTVLPLFFLVIELDLSLSNLPQLQGMSLVPPGQQAFDLPMVHEFSTDRRSVYFTPF